MNFTPKKTLIACLAIAISSTAYAQDDLLTRLVGGVANAIITKAGDKIKEHRKERQKERQEKIRKDRQNPEYYAKVGTQTCHKATNIHEKYVPKLILAKDDAAYQKTLRSYYQDYADLFMGSADKAADKSEVKAIIEIVNTVRNKTTSYEERKQVTSDQEFQETISNFTQEIQKGCLSSMSVAADETARKERRAEYKDNVGESFDVEFGNSPEWTGNSYPTDSIRFLIEPNFYDDGERRYIENRVCSVFDDVVVHDKYDKFYKVNEKLSRWSDDKNKSSQQLFDEQDKTDIRFIPKLKALAYVGTYVGIGNDAIHKRERPLYKISRNSEEFDIDIAKTCSDVQSKIAKKKERIATKYAENGEKIRQYWVDKKKECLTQEHPEYYKWKKTEKYRYFDGKYVEEGECVYSDAYYRKEKKECNEAGRRWFADEKRCESLDGVIRVNDYWWLFK
ncbi:MAG: hypothetical protein IJ187_02820 [Neisseriaceae bacterium]|nr:hypothetical protein [Neisseriaceae bacterium]MBQ9725095.1 hypothetical protein [Neisseriaceae bacterium]